MHYIYMIPRVCIVKPDIIDPVGLCLTANFHVCTLFNAVYTCYLIMVLIFTHQLHLIFFFGQYTRSIQVLR
jgi:hypothetical protein